MSLPSFSSHHRYKKNRLASLEAQMKTLQSEINLKSNAANADPEKLKARQERLTKLQKEAEYYRTTLKRLDAIREDFYKKLQYFRKCF